MRKTVLNHRLHYIWEAMKSRCYNPNNVSHHNYGGRGIHVCSEWKSNYVVFQTWAMSQPNYQTGTLDRRDNDGNYTPDNCRFTTPLVQARNSRHIRLLTAFGETKCISEWAEDPRCKVCYGTLAWRINMGVPAEESITVVQRGYPKNYKINLRGAGNFLVTAFGEEKCLMEWTRDPRCRVSYQILWQRLRRYGYTPEEAMTKPSRYEGPG
jgi:hypothetical protein